MKEDDSAQQTNSTEEGEKNLRWGRKAPAVELVLHLGPVRDANDAP